MSGLNRWQGIVTLGADPEPRFTQGGTAVLNLRGACNETFRGEDGQSKEFVTWLNFTVWGKRAEALGKVLGKGDRLYIEGPLRISTYDDRDGNKRMKVEVHVRELEFAGGNGQRGAATAGGRGRRENDGSEEPSGGRGGGHGRGGSGSAPAQSRGGGAASTPPAEDYGGFASDDDVPF